MLYELIRSGTPVVPGVIKEVLSGSTQVIFGKCFHCVYKLGGNHAVSCKILVAGVKTAEFFHCVWHNICL